MYLLMSVARTAPEALFQSFPALRNSGTKHDKAIQCKVNIGAVH